MRPFFITRMGNRKGHRSTPSGAARVPLVRSAPTVATATLRHLAVPLAALVVVIGAPGPAGAQGGDSPGPTSGNAEARPDGVPGAGEVVRLARPTWDTGWFQAEIAARLLDELGYEVDGPMTWDNEAFYAGLGDGSVDLWLSGWLPLHQPLIDGETTHRRREVPAIARIVDQCLLHGGLREQVIHIDALALGPAHHHGLRERGDAAAHAVQLPPVGIARADGRTQERIAVLGQILPPEEQPLRGAAPHEHGSHTVAHRRRLRRWWLPVASPIITRL